MCVGSVGLQMRADQYCLGRNAVNTDHPPSVQNSFDGLIILDGLLLDARCMLDGLGSRLMAPQSEGWKLVAELFPDCSPDKNTNRPPIRAKYDCHFNPILWPNQLDKSLADNVAPLGEGFDKIKMTGKCLRIFMNHVFARLRLAERRTQECQVFSGFVESHIHTKLSLNLHRGPPSQRLNHK